jgi:HSP20 family protein
MTHWERDWQNLKDVMEHMLQDSSRTGIGVSIVWHPPTDAYETETQFVVRMDVAGVKREDLSVHLDEGCLLIRGIRRDQVPPGKKHFYKMEITMGPFERKVPLPRHLNISELAATYRDGILEIRCNKSHGTPGGEVRVTIE